MKIKLTAILALLALTSSAATFTNIFLPGNWPAATWWTNVPPPTSIVASNAYLAINENFNRVSNTFTALQGGLADLIAFGRPFINNPDLVERFVHGWLLSNDLHTNTFYTPGEKGYTDYPMHVK